MIFLFGAILASDEIKFPTATEDDTDMSLPFHTTTEWTPWDDLETFNYEIPDLENPELPLQNSTIDQAAL